MATSPAQLFIFTAGDPAARSHLDDSIKNPIDLQRALAAFPDTEHQKLRALSDGGGLYAWGAIPGKQNNPRWQSIQPGDWMLCVYESTYHYVAQVTAKYDNDALAREVWGATDEGKTWSLMYFLTRPRKISASIADLSDYLSKGYMGFSRIGSDKCASIVQDYGSLEAFIENRLVNPEQSAANEAHIMDAITREDIIRAFEQIEAGDLAGFSQFSDYEILYENRRYPPKATIGIAARRTLGRTLRPDEFRGGINAKYFQTIRKLGFEIVKKESSFFLIRSNPESPYADELGLKYHFSNRVPNHKKLLNGAEVVVDSKTVSGLRLLGFGALGPAEELSDTDGLKEYICDFITWNAFTPTRQISDAVQARIRDQKGYNVQHAIRPIDKELFTLLTEDLAEPELCLIGSAATTDAELTAIQKQIEDTGGYASWWSFIVKVEAQAELKKPFYLYLNAGGGTFPLRFKVDEFRTLAGPDGMESPWPEITLSDEQGKTHSGTKSSQVFKTWFKVSAVESMTPPLGLVDFKIAQHLSNERNVLNQNAFGYVYRKAASEVDLEPYTLDQALDGVFMEQSEFEEILALFGSKKNIILQGAPGTGKTFIAKRLAYALMGEKASDRSWMIQFHQSYAYEDFIGGYRPIEGSETGAFGFKKGVFYRFCDQARIQPNKKFVFIIDEINRGNLSKIFGEVMMLVERDKRGDEWAMPLTYSKDTDPPFCIPENVFLLGLMNTADRSLAMVDYALRRRFAFRTLIPAFGSPKLRAHLTGLGIDDAVVDKVFSQMNSLNKEIEEDRDLGRGFIIGHSFFSDPEVGVPTEDWYRRVIETEIAPLLAEYWFDKTSKQIADRVAQMIA